MRTAACSALFVFASILPAAGAAQSDTLLADVDRGHPHILHVSDAFPSAPGGQGLLRIAVAEGEIAALHAALAAEAVNSLSDVRLHVEHMLHALDPSLVLAGPGLGYGLRRATEEALYHIEMAATSEGASDNVRTHAPHVAAALRGALDRANAMVELAQEIELATSAAAAGALLARLNELSSGLVQGRDVDGDRLVGWQAGEGGLRQASQHMALLKRGEGLVAP